MPKRHDERKCLRSLSKVCRIDGNHIIGNANSIGIHRWGMIDYLTHYCGYVISLTEKAINPSALRFSDDLAETSVRAAKKARKEPKLTNKKK